MHIIDAMSRRHISRGSSHLASHSLDAQQQRSITKCKCAGGGVPVRKSNTRSRVLIGCVFRASVRLYAVQCEKCARPSRECANHRLIAYASAQPPLIIIISSNGTVAVIAIHHFSYAPLPLTATSCGIKSNPIIDFGLNDDVAHVVAACVPRVGLARIGAHVRQRVSHQTN